MNRVAVYAGTAGKFGAVSALLGAALGLYSAYANEKRRTTTHLGRADLVYLNEHDDVVYALSCIKDRSGMSVDELAEELENLAELAVRMDTEQVVGPIKYHVARRAGHIEGILGHMQSVTSSDPDFAEHIGTIHRFADDTRHNAAL
jgi:hypothetical protein